jgi:glycosyltransferase involved in cell wall biosynthesis
MRVSVIVPAHNSQATIDRCLSALDRQACGAHYEVLLVDDGSTDSTRARARAHKVRVLKQPHAGPAAARNLGAQHARGEILLFTDADCEPAPDWIEQMIAPLSDPQTVGVKGVYRSRQTEIVARFVQMEYETRYQKTAQHMAREGRIDFVDTYAAGYRRDVFLANKGFDPAFATASVEDQEFSFRLASQGHRLVFAPQAVVYHWGHASTLWGYARKKYKIGYHKVDVLARNSAKLWNDSHTPQRLKVQIGLLGLGGASLVLAFLWPPLLWAAASLGTLFGLSTLPFVLSAWAEDRCVAIVSPPLLLLRAAALGSGLLIGGFGYLSQKAAAFFRGTASRRP